MITIHVPKKEAEHIIKRIDTTPKGIELVGIEFDLDKYTVDLSDDKIRIFKTQCEVGEGAPIPTGTARAGPVCISSLAELKLHNLCESKIQSATIAGKQIDKLSYSNLMRVVYSEIGSADRIIQTTTTNIKQGKHTTKGFKYFEPMDFSCQGVDANSAAREILHMSQTHSIDVDLAIKLVTGDTVNIRNIHDKGLVDASDRVCEPGFEVNKVVVVETASSTLNNNRNIGGFNSIETLVSTIHTDGESISDFNESVSENASITEKDNSYLREFVCTFCNRACSNEYNLKKHMIACKYKLDKLKNSKMYVCEYCNKNMDNEYNYNAHTIYCKQKPIITKQKTTTSQNINSLPEQAKSITGIPIYKMVDTQTRNTIIENINSGLIESECLTGKKQKWWLKKHHPDNQIPKRIYELTDGTIKELYDKYVVKFGAIDWAVFICYTRELIKQKIMVI